MYYPIRFPSLCGAFLWIQQFLLVINLIFLAWQMIIIMRITYQSFHVTVKIAFLFSEDKRIPCSKNWDFCAVLMMTAGENWLLVELKCILFTILKRFGLIWLLFESCLWIFSAVCRHFGDKVYWQIIEVLFFSSKTSNKNNV